MAPKWYNLSPEQCAEHLNSDLNVGLSQESVKARTKKYGINKVFHIPNASFKECLRACSTDVTIYLMIIMALMCALFGQGFSAIVILSLVAINFASILIAYYKSKSNLSKIGNFTMPMSKVIRDGKIYTIKHTEIVVGDIILLAKGDVVPSDSRIISSDSLVVLEPDIKGHKSAKKKNAQIIYGENISYDERSNMVYATSIVTSGNATAIACGCGDFTFARATKQNTTLVNHRDLKVIRTLRRYSSVLSFAMIVLITFICLIDLILGFKAGLTNTFLTASSLCCAAMTQSYVIFSYIIVGHSIQDSIYRSGKINSGAVVKNISSFEKLKEIDTLILSKRGGFFASTSTIESIFASDILHKTSERKLGTFCNYVLKWALLSTGFETKPNLFADTANEAYAIGYLCSRIGLDPKIVAIENPLICVGEKFSDIGCESAIIRGDDTNTAVIRGEAAPLLENCSYYYHDGKKRKIDKHQVKRINEALRTIDLAGLRAIAVVTKKTMAESFDDVSDGDWILEGILGIREPVLTGTEKTLAACKEAGIHVIVITEEEPDTAARLYFKRMGLIDNDDQIMTSSRLSAMKDNLFRTNISLYHMYEGLSLSQKRLLLSHLKEDGHTVGIMGSELEDIILMNEANIGFSSVSSLASRAPKLRENEKLSKLESCEALRLSSDVLVSSPDDPRGGFNAIVSTIKEAKSIYQDIMHMVKYLITSQIARLVVILYSIIARSSWPTFLGDKLLSPTQILFLGLIVDLGVVFSIALQKPPKDILTQKEHTEERLENPLSFALKPLLFGVFWGIITIGVPLLIRLLGLNSSPSQITTMIFVSLVISQLCCAFETMHERSITHGISPSNKFMQLFCVICMAFMIFVSIVPAVGAIFDLGQIGIIHWICTLITPVIMVVVYEIYKHIKH